MPSLSSRAVFQSTRPVWGATHSPASDPGCARISIHAPRVGRDSSFRRCPCTAAAFQSTRPVWGATRADGWRRYVLQHFNPRAPCGARRRGRLAAHAGMANFNPRAPCGARPPGSPFAPSLPDFNPRAPCGARQALTVFYRCHKAISIHAPRVGRDEHAVVIIRVHCPFQSTRPVWGATMLFPQPQPQPQFQSTRPVWGATAAS